jgi:hypothetical protein
MFPLLTHMQNGAPPGRVRLNRNQLPLGTEFGAIIPMWNDPVRPVNLITNQRGDVQTYSTSPDRLDLEWRKGEGHEPRFGLTGKGNLTTNTRVVFDHLYAGNTSNYGVHNLAAWVYWEDNNEAVTNILTRNEDGSSRRIGISKRTDGSSAWVGADWQANQNAQATRTVPVGFGRWIHIVAQFNGNAWRRIYVNGEGPSTSTTLKGGTNNGEELVLFGRMPDSYTADNTNTTIGEVVVSKGWLWDAETIKAMYAPQTRWRHYLPAALKVFSFPPEVAAGSGAIAAKLAGHGGLAGLGGLAGRHGGLAG